MRSLDVLLALLAAGAASLSCWSSGNRGGPGSVVHPPVGSVTTCAGDTAPLPALIDLPRIDALPDPFQSIDGTRITSADQWTCRRVEIGAQAAAYELGDKPDKPASVTGAFSNGQLTVTVGDGNGKSISFVATVTPPTNGAQTPYPAMIGMGGVGIDPAGLNAMGVATINFPNDTVAQQNNMRALGVFYDFYGADHSAGAMMAWAWGVSRMIDALETTPDAQIDPTRLGVTGCSRNGKGALIAGAFDERIALTIPQESGSGGSASWRVSDWQNTQNSSDMQVQSLMEIVGENVWFRLSFRDFASAATQLPFDHHEIEGLVAPRALLIIENTSQIWLGNKSTYNDSMAAHEIWQALGIPDHMGVSQLDTGTHCLGFTAQNQPKVAAYVHKFLIGDGTDDTNVLKTDGGYAYDQATWAPWDSSL